MEINDIKLYKCGAIFVFNILKPAYRIKTVIP